MKHDQDRVFASNVGGRKPFVAIETARIPFDTLRDAWVGADNRFPDCLDDRLEWMNEFIEELIHRPGVIPFRGLPLGARLRWCFVGCAHGMRPSHLSMNFTKVRKTA